MSGIIVQNLKKTYRVHRKSEGLRASVRSLFRRKYKQVRAVDGISFNIEPGEMVGFLGPNGAGKTTTLKMLSGLIYPTAGEATVLGYVPWERQNAYRRRFALLMGQKNQLWWDLPASESFRLHKEIYGIEDDKFRAVLGELTEMLGIEKLLDQPVRELSLGERMKMELIAGLLHSPEVLFLDEPTIGLDIVAQVNIRQCLRTYNELKKVTIVLTSHYMQDIEALCERVMVIGHGRLIHDGPLRSIVQKLAGYKILTLHFREGDIPDRLDDVGEILEMKPPKVTIKLPREAVAKRAGYLLSTYQIDDVSVADPPIEDVISELYSQDPDPESMAGDENTHELD